MSFVKSFSVCSALVAGMLAAAPSSAAHFTSDGIFTAHGPMTVSALGGAIRLRCYSDLTIRVVNGVGSVTNAFFSPDPNNGLNPNCNNLRTTFTNGHWGLDITSASGGVAQNVQIAGINGNPMTCGPGPILFTVFGNYINFNGQLNPGACEVSSGSLFVNGVVPLSITNP